MPQIFDFCRNGSENFDGSIERAFMIWLKMRYTVHVYNFTYLIVFHVSLLTNCKAISIKGCHFGKWAPLKGVYMAIYEIKESLHVMTIKNVR